MPVIVSGDAVLANEMFPLAELVALKLETAFAPFSVVPASDKVLKDGAVIAPAPMIVAVPRFVFADNCK